MDITATKNFPGQMEFLIPKQWSQDCECEEEAGDDGWGSFAAYDAPKMQQMLTQYRVLLLDAKNT